MAELKTLNGYEIVDQTARDKINTMVNDGINLYTGTANFTGPWKNLSAWTFYKSTINPNTMCAQYNGLWNGLYQNIQVTEGETYTLSAWVAASDNIDVFPFFSNSKIQDSCSVNCEGIDYFAVKTIRRISYTTKVTKSGIMTARFECGSNPNNATFYIFGIKLERSSFPTPYVPDSLPLSGTTVPSNDYGRDGDFYVMY